MQGFLAMLLASCGLGVAPEATPTAGLPAQPTATAAPSVSDLGTRDNPLILALPPSPRLSDEVQGAGSTLARLLEKGTGYVIVPVVPPSESDLVAGFGNGNAHIGVLSPYGYVLAREGGSADAAFAREQAGAIFYGSQFIAHADVGFRSFFDPINGGNSVEAPVALGQFEGKKPCFTDPKSPSGYVVPLGYLKLANIQTREPAFLAGHVSVVRALAAGGICDFGATYVDARTYPGLEDQYPGLLKKVLVIWRVPPIIPYETVAFAHGMDEGMRRVLIRALVDAMGTSEGKSAMQTLYGIEAMQVVQDSQYDEFRKMVKASGLDVGELVK